MKVHVINNTGEVFIFPVFPTLSNSAVFPSGLTSYMLYTPESSDVSSFDTKGVISDSPKNSLGERSCLNYQFKGGLTSISAKDIQATRTTYKLNGASPPETVPAVLFRSQSRSVTIRSTDLFYQSIPSSLQQYPDFELNKVRYENIYCAMWTEDNKVFWREASWSFAVFPYTKYSIVTYKAGYQLDVINRKARRTIDNGGSQWSSWYSWDAFKLFRKGEDTPMPSQHSFPTSWESYYRLLARIGKSFEFPIESNIYGDLVRRCANDAQVIQTNGIELATELHDIRNSVMKVLTLVGKEVSPAVLAAGFLSYKYGLRLTGIGVKTVFEDVINELHRRIGSDNVARSRAREVVNLYPTISSLPMKCLVEYNYKMFHSVRSDDWRDPLRTWFDSSLFPSLTNVWDLIPLSFVLDWFVRVEDYLNAIDANTYWSLYDILGITYSQKRTYSGISHYLSTTGYTFFGDATLIDYDRKTRRTAHKPLFFESSPRIFKNYAALTALIVANSQ